MNKVLNRAVLTCAVLSSLAGASMNANAAAFATICNDLSCTGGDDFIVQDNGAGDTSPILGAINLSASAFGFNVLVNTSQSKPVVGSAGAPQLDVTFSATTNSNAASTVFLYMSDTDFIGAQSFLLSVGGTNSGGSGSITSRAWGGTSDTPLQFSPANLLASVASSGATFAGSTSGILNPVVNPFSLTIGVAITRTTAGTTTGDLNFAATPVPEPGTYAMMLAGLGLMGFVGSRRKKS